MARPLLQIQSLIKSFGGILATDNVSLEVEENEVHAVIGPNGAGKTTLISQLTGLLASDSGKVTFDGRDITRMKPYNRSLIGLARSFQITSIFKDMTVMENVMLAVQAHQGHSYRFWSPARKDKSLVEPAQAALERVQLSHRADRPAGQLSHGGQRQLEIAMALAAEPRMLLLDEPMAGMGPEESSRMVDFLKTLKGSVSILMVEHDMDAVFALADRISVLVYGSVIATGLPEEIRNNPEVKAAYLGGEAA